MPIFQAKKSKFNLDINKLINYYNRRFNTRLSRIPLHVSFWFIYFSLQLINIKLAYSISMGGAIIFALRNILYSASTFYLLVYFFIPGLLKKNHYILFILACLSTFWINNIINYLSVLFIIKYTNLQDPVLLPYVKRIATFNFSYIISVKNVLEFSMGLFYISSLPIMLKVFFDFINASGTRSFLEKQNLVLELGFLKSQLNPHFLFNALNNIYSLSFKSDPRAPDFILKLSDLMRYTLYETTAELVPLSKEIAFLKNYIELEKVRYNSRTSISFKTDFAEDEIRGIQIAPLVFFCFVENAFKHGLNARINNSWVEILISYKEGILILHVVNSCGSNTRNNTSVPVEVGGIGVFNTQKRLSILYENHYELKTEQTEEVYSIKLKINLSQHETSN